MSFSEHRANKSLKISNLLTVNGRLYVDVFIYHSGVWIVLALDGLKHLRTLLKCRIVFRSIHK